MVSSAQFDKAVKIVQELPKGGPVNPSEADKLFFYSRYKQVTVGDVNTAKPGMLDFVGRYKWEAWDKIKGKSEDDAMKEYVDKLLEMLTQAGGQDQLINEINTA